eukprot:scaffold411708_cov37-Prasinocladus_malaysianus.AAC.1
MAPRWLSWFSGHTGDVSTDGAGQYQPIGDPEDEAACPEDRAGPISRLFFHFASPLIRTGAQKSLDPEDLWDLSKV